MEKLAHISGVHHGLGKQYQQATEFYALYHEKLTIAQGAMLQAYGTLEKQTVLQKMKILTNYQLYKKGVIRKAGQILL